MMYSNGRHVYGGRQFYCWRKQENSKKTTDLSQVVLNLTTIRALGIDCHYILIIEFLKLLLSVFIISFIFVIVSDLCELKRIWLFISIMPLEIQLSRKNEFWCLTPLSAIFQLYHGDQFYWWRMPEYPERTIDPGQATGKLYHLRLRAEGTLFVIYKGGREPTPYW
jgi:hypothetical protein